MASAKKPSAADRTIPMFGGPLPDINNRPVEAIEDEEKAERVPVEEDVNNLRDKAFKGQEWCTECFGSFDAPGNEYRVSKRGPYYYVETVLKEICKPTAYGYVGLMVHERDIMALTKVMVAAVRAKQEAEKK